MQFLPYQPEHLNRCLELYDSNCPEYFAPHERPEFIEWLGRDTIDSPYWVQVVDDEIVGCGGIYTSNDHQKDSIYGGEVGFAWGMVDSKYHKKGYGKELFHYRLDYMKTNHPDTPIILRTSQLTYQFFAKYGFETLEFTEDGWDKGLHKHEMIYRDPTLAMIETERFRLRKFEKHDGQHLLQLNQNPNVVKFLPMDPFTTVEDGEKDVAAKMGHYDKHGIGRWLVIEKLTGDCMGWCGMSWLEDEQVMDIGWRIKEEHWGKGIATETATACLEYAHTELKQKRVVAHAYIENKASVRIMKKLGMAFVGHGEYKGHPLIIYESVRG